MTDRPVEKSLNPFRIPAGPLGRVAGWLMARDDGAHHELVGLLAPAPGSRICEVGYGPGQLLELIARRDPAAQLCGVDPSSVMLAQARRRLARAGAADRADLRIGVADSLPFADDSADYVVAVNSAALWRDREAGLIEARRVLRPGGRLLLAWHSATSPVFFQRRIAQPESWWTETTAMVRRLFGNAERHDLPHTTACSAVLNPG